MKRLITLIAIASASLPLFAGNVCGRVTSCGKPLAGVQVSDGNTIVTTDATGRYSFDSDKTSCCVFITTPSGYVAQSTDGIRPGFWQYLVLPAEQDEIHDFALIPENQDTYTVFFPTDVHLVNDPRRQDIMRFKNIVFPHVCKRTELAKANGPVYSFNLGDFTHDIYWYEYNMSESDGLRLIQDLGWPTAIYSVTGNHDHDGGITGENVDFRSAWRYRNVWGPDRYSVNIGRDHWIFLDNLVYINEPGKGKKAPGINGDRSYKHALTDAQLDWLEKDLAGISKDTRVYICCHAPILRTIKNSGTLLPVKQTEKLDAMAAAFENGITIFSGHIHRFDICDRSEFPNLHQISLPATSGTMWETPIDWTLTSSDGSDAGIMEAEITSGSAPRLHFECYTGGEKLYRVYDMNEVGKAYKASAEAKKQLEMFKGSRLYYGSSKYRNYVYVNFWGRRPGDRIQLFENGKELPCETLPHEDPTCNFAYDLQVLSGTTQHHTPKGKSSCESMYEFKTHGAKTPLLLRITDKDGKVRAEETIIRPVVFNPSGK